MTDVTTPLQLLIRKLDSRARLDKEDQAALLALDYRLRVVQRAEYIIREAQPPGLCQVLIDGIAMRTKMTLDGFRQIMSLQFPGDMMDLQHLYFDYADHNLQALTICRVAEVDRASVQRLMETRPSLMRALTVEIASEASIHREWALNVGRRSGRARIAHLICEFAYRRGLRNPDSGFEILLPMTQDEMGDATSLTSVHVNRMLKELTDSKLILRGDRYRIIILDWIRLQSEAGFNPRYLHMKQGKDSF